MHLYRICIKCYIELLISSKVLKYYASRSQCRIILFYVLRNGLECKQKYFLNEATAFHFITIHFVSFSVDPNNGRCSGGSHSNQPSKKCANVTRFPSRSSEADFRCVQVVCKLSKKEGTCTHTRDSRFTYGVAKQSLETRTSP